MKRKDQAHFTVTARHEGAMPIDLEMDLSEGWVVLLGLGDGVTLIHGGLTAIVVLLSNHPWACRTI